MTLSANPHLDKTLSLCGVIKVIRLKFTIQQQTQQIFGLVLTTTRLKMFKIVNSCYSVLGV